MGGLLNGGAKIDSYQYSDEDRFKIQDYVLSQNKTISIRQIQEGIAYGWYYLSPTDNEPRIEVNNYNYPLWEDDCQEDFVDLRIDRTIAGKDYNDKIKMEKAKNNEDTN